MTRLRSGPLAAWASAWLHGGAASDEVIRAVTGDDAPHVVQQPDGDQVPLSGLLIEWRRSADRARVVLPVPGDVRGLPGPAPFRAAALDAGEAVLGGGLGLVPEITDYRPSSAPTSVLWRAFRTDPAPPDPLSVADAQHDLTETIRQCASALLAGGAAGSALAGVADLLADARRAGERLNLPPGHPPRAVRLVAQAERLAAVLELAAADPIGAAVDKMGMQLRADALRPLRTAVRRARVAGYNDGTE